MFLFLSHGIKIIQTIEEISLHLLVGSISIWYTFEMDHSTSFLSLDIKKGGTFLPISTNFHQAIPEFPKHIWFWRFGAGSHGAWTIDTLDDGGGIFTYGKCMARFWSFGPLVLGCLLCLFIFSGPALFLLHLRRVFVFFRFEPHPRVTFEYNSN